MLALTACGAPESAVGDDGEQVRMHSADIMSASHGVFSMSNAAGPNTVLVYKRTEGNLTAVGEVATGGLGDGKGLGSQGALTFSHDNRFLLVVNPGSGDVSSFKVEGTTLTLRSRVASGGRPISVAEHEGLVYVLDGAGSMISGLRLAHDGTLTAIANSTRPLSAASVGAAQVGFSPDGSAIVVTEKGTSLIDVYPVADDGTTGDGAAYASSGMTPFGFAFDKRGDLLVSEAFGAKAGQAAVSSYAVDADADANTTALITLSGSVADGQTAACWVAVTGNGHFAFTTNAASDNISTYKVAKNGTITVTGSPASTGAGSHPTDMAVDAGSFHLFAIDAFTHQISGFLIGDQGQLTATSTISGLPATSVGLAAN